MGAASRNKGAKSEREAARLIQGWLNAAGIAGADMRRNVDQAPSGGFDLLGLPWLAVEVKRVESALQGQWWRQAVAQGEREGRKPVLMYRRNRQPWRFRTTAAVIVGDNSERVTVDIDLDAEQARKWLLAEVAANLE